MYLTTMSNTQMLSYWEIKFSVGVLEFQTTLFILNHWNFVGVDKICVKFINTFIIVIKLTLTIYLNSTHL
jgi:hypothetical protein